MQFINSIFGYPLGWLMWLCYKIVANYGIALIIFTLLTKLILFPLAVKQQKSSLRMARMQPKLEELQKKYGKNKEKYNEEMLKLYDEEKYNPMSGCLPLLIQFPILFGLIDVIYKPMTHILRIPSDVIKIATDIATNNGSIMSYSPQLLAIQGITQNPQPYIDAMGADVVSHIQSLNLSFFGLDLSQTPTVALNVLILIPILSGLTSFLFTMLTMKTNPSMQQQQGAGTGCMTKVMQYIMPIFSLVIAFQVPAGVGMYWIFSNVFSTFQQMLLNKKYNSKIAAEEAEREYDLQKKKKDKVKRQVVEVKDEETGKVTEKTLTQKEIDRQRLAEARKRDAEKYGEEYVEVTDDDLKS